MGLFFLTDFILYFLKGYPDAAALRTANIPCLTAHSICLTLKHSVNKGKFSHLYGKHIFVKLNQLTSLKPDLTDTTIYMMKVLCPPPPPIYIRFIHKSKLKNHKYKYKEIFKVNLAGEYIYIYIG